MKAYAIAVGFGNVAMLGWLAAVAIPIAIHLWNRRIRDEVPWATVDFLLAAERQNSRRIRLENLLLLLMRCCVLLLIVLAASQPYLESYRLSWTPGRRTLRIFVIDGSYSMDYRQGESSLFQLAKRDIAKVVEQSALGDQFCLFLIADPSHAVVGRPTLSAEGFLRELEYLRQPEGGGDLAGAIQLMQEFLQSPERQGSEVDYKQVTIYSDLGKPTWSIRAAASEKPHPAIDELVELSRDAPVTIVDLGSPARDNLAVVNLHLVSPVVTRHTPQSIIARLQNFGAVEHRQARVDLFIDGHVVQSRRVDVPAAGHAEVHFQHRFDVEGLHQVHVEFHDDLLPLDNHRYLVVQVEPQERVLVVEGQRRAGELLVHALEASVQTSESIDVTTIPAYRLREALSDEFSSVFLVDVPRFSTEEINRIGQFVEAGGGAVLFLGDNTQADSYNQLFALPETDAGVLTTKDNRLAGVELLGEREATNASFDPREYTHPIVQVFAGNENAGLLTTPVFKYHRLRMLGDSPRARAALSFTSGDPAIVTSPFGKGRVVLICIPPYAKQPQQPLAGVWSAWPAWPSFLPLVRESANYAVAGRNAQWNHYVGDPLQLSLPESATPIMCDVKIPAGGTHVFAATSEQSGPVLPDSVSSKSGFVTVKAKSSGTDVQPQEFALNLRTGESNLTAVPDAYVPEAISRIDLTSDPDSRGVSHASGPQSIVTLLVLGALALLLSETVLAGLMGRHAA